ncbi:FAD dependent oxidoreductase [Lactarius psammicola]|nr:FAD dependent oxidoreductase [Lactarius psammicola]
MLSVPFTLSVFSILFARGIPAVLGRSTSQQDFQATCHDISSVISNASQVFFSPAIEYISDNEHAFVSSSEVAACSIEPGSVNDVGLILQMLGKSRTPFGVKSGGHATNRGFSSTRGVQISLARFNTFNVNSEAQTVELGPSLLWEDVYQRLDPYGVTVIGGRIPGVGVGGLILGGGYSFKSNEYGLAIDNVVAYELVLPNGTVTTITANDHDLWFALRGGGNNFGIVTKFTVKSYPQGQVWGGGISYGPGQLGAVKNAIIEFSNVTDTNATLLFGLFYSSGEVVSIVVPFYNSPLPPSGIFDAFLRIPHLQQDVHTRSYADLINSQASLGATPGDRGHYSGFPTTNYSLAFLDAITDQILKWGSQLSPLDPKVVVGAGGEPFERGFFSHGTPSAYPPDRSHVFFPSVLTFSWSNSTLDEMMTRAIRETTDSLHMTALKDGQDVEHAAVYPNYALFDTPLEDMYGQNVPRLQSLKCAIDPENVMGLAGGFKF